VIPCYPARSEVTDNVKRHTHNTYADKNGQKKPSSSSKTTIIMLTCMLVRMVTQCSGSVLNRSANDQFKFSTTTIYTNTCCSKHVN